MEGGRPRYYESPEDLAKAAGEYFEYIKGESETTQFVDDNGNLQQKSVWKRLPEPATITGLILYLGFSHREALIDYEKREGFSDITKRIRLQVECEYEKKLSGNSPTGSIFALKNMGWQDKTQLQHSGDQESPIIFKKADGRAVKP